MSKFSEQLAPLARTLGVPVPVESKMPTINIPVNFDSDPEVVLPPIGAPRRPPIFQRPQGTISASTRPNPPAPMAPPAGNIVITEPVFPLAPGYGPETDDDVLMGTVSRAELEIIDRDPTLLMMEEISENYATIDAEMSASARDLRNQVVDQVIENEMAMDAMTAEAELDGDDILNAEIHEELDRQDEEAEYERERIYGSDFPPGHYNVIDHDTGPEPAVEPEEIPNDPAPATETATDDLSEIGITPEQYARMVDDMRAMNEEKVKSALIAALPAMFSARALSAGTDVVTYVAENAMFRDALFRLFKLLNVEVPKDEIEKITIDGESRAFASRGPNIFQMRQAIVQALSATSRLREIDTRFHETETARMNTESRLSAALSELLSIKRERSDEQNELVALRRFKSQTRMAHIYRVRWTLMQKTAEGVVNFPAWLSRRKTPDGSVFKPGPNGVLPLKAFFVTKNIGDALTFDDFEVAQRTLETVKRNSTALSEKVNKAFNARYLVSAVIEQVAFVDHDPRYQTVKD